MAHSFLFWYNVRAAAATNGPAPWPHLDGGETCQVYHAHSDRCPDSSFARGAISPSRWQSSTIHGLTVHVRCATMPPAVPGVVIIRLFASTTGGIGSSMQRSGARSTSGTGWKTESKSIRGRARHTGQTLKHAESVAVSIKLDTMPGTWMPFASAPEGITTPTDRIEWPRCGPTTEITENGGWKRSNSGAERMKTWHVPPSGFTMWTTQRRSRRTPGGGRGSTRLLFAYGTTIGGHGYGRPPGSAQKGSGGPGGSTTAERAGCVVLRQTRWTT